MDGTTIVLPTYSKAELKLRELVGYGSFSKVYLANFRNKEELGLMVAKIPRPRNSEEEVANEANLMVKLNHVNVIKLIGMAEGPSEDVENSSLNWIILEYACYGNLLDFIAKRREDDLGLDEHLWVKISLGIAKGMEYLHKKRIVHTDLHTKNCLVAKDEIVKIGDLGLAFNMGSNKQEELMLNGPLGDVGRPKDFPVLQVITGVRWKAPEYIPGEEFPPLIVRAGDVWAYGVLLFEFWTEGVEPFQYLNNKEVAEVLIQGITPLEFRKVMCPPFVRKVMETCFKHAPNRRPTFAQIVYKLEMDLELFED